MFILLLTSIHRNHQSEEVVSDNGESVKFEVALAYTTTSSVQDDPGYLSGGI